MDDRIFTLYRKVLNLLDTDKERTIFQRGFDLGKCEGVAQCTKQLEPLTKKLDDIK